MLARLEKEAKTGKVADDVQLLKCDIYAIGAARMSDRVKRDELLKKALLAYEQYIESHGGAENRPRAESSYVDAALNFGRSLSSSMDDAAGAELAAIKKDLQETLTKAVSKTAELVAALKANPSRTESEDRQLYELMMNRGALLVVIARSQDDGSFSFGQAKAAYEEVVDRSGDTSSAGLRSFIGIGDVNLAEGKPKEAVEFFLFVGDTAIPRDAAEWESQTKELGPEEVQRRFALLQLATPGVMQSLMASGDSARACGEGVRFLNVWNRYGLALVPPYGYQSLLEIVGALSEAGGFIGGDLKAGGIEWFSSAEALQAKFTQKRQQRSALDLALALAQQVNEDNRGNSLGARAQRLIGDLIQQPGVEVSPDILIEAARGKAGDRDFAGAIEAYKRVLNAVESTDPATRTLYGSKVLNAMGRAYMGMERPLEAALVFQEAVSNWLGDAEFDQLNSRGLYNAANALKRKIKGDALIDGLFAAAEAAVKQHDTIGAGEVLYMGALKIYENEKDFLKAREAYRAVPDNTASYEKALVYVGVCEYQLGRDKNDYSAAIRIFDDYLNKFLKDPLHALGAAETTKEAKRAEAVATAVFYWGLAEFNLADAGKGDWKKVVELLGGYEDRFPKQESFANAAMYRVILAQFKLGNQEAVDQIYEKMLTQFPNGKWNGTAALDIYAALETEYKRLKDSKEPADQAKAKEALRKMAQYLEVGNKNASNPSFANLRRESQHWMDLQEWAKAEALLAKLKAKFETGATAEDVRQYVLPDLAQAMFEQQKMAEAADLLKPLVDENKASFKSVVIYARALSGYVIQVLDENGRPRSMRVVPGVGGADAFAKSAELFDKLLGTVKNKEGAWTPPWLELKFDQIYCIHLWSKVEGKIAADAKAQLRLLQTEYDGENFPNLQDAALKARFIWLAGQIQ
ncbi:MAG: hypothetical protein IPK67_19995 [Planctomycetes bacterium]|nr:hypothetical protein [Planctomycetota bacterium]